MKTRLFGTTEKELLEAAKVLQNGGLVAFPTETVYGLGADAMNEEAVSKVYKAKGRPSDNPMIVHIAEKDDLRKLTFNVTPEMEKLADCFWPGPMTMVVDAKPEIPRVTTGGLDTVAVRMPDSEETLELIRLSKTPLAGPSANLSGHPSPTTAMHVKDDLDGRIDGIIEGNASRVGIESTVVDMTVDPPMILRPGYVTKERLSMVLGKEVGIDPAILKKPDIFNNGGLLETGEDYKPKSPGMKYKHYAPKAEMIIFSGSSENVKAAMGMEKIAREEKGQTVGVIYFENSEPEKAAHEFFGALRKFDKENVDVILASAIEETGLGLAVMNRMFKSAGYNIKEV